jgi:hypothetical protein
MPSIDTLSLRIPVRSPTLIGLDFPLIAVISITGKRKQFLTYTMKNYKSKGRATMLSKTYPR